MSLAVVKASIPTMSVDALAKVNALEAEIAKHPQLDVETDHVFHAGMYARTVTLPANAVFTGAQHTKATLLIVQGDVTLYLGDDTLRVTGYAVVPASVGRKTAYWTHSETTLTVVAPTDCTTVEDVEREMTTDPMALVSKRCHNKVTNTGE